MMGMVIRMCNGISKDKMASNTPCVYFIADGRGNCKIGVASDIKSRLNTLQVGSPVELILKDCMYFSSIDEAYHMERDCHFSLRNYNVRGEWFEEKAVDDYLTGKSLNDGKTYMVDEVPEFSIYDALKLYSILLESTSKEEAKQRYEDEMPEYWKQYDKENGRKL